MAGPTIYLDTNVISSLYLQGKGVQALYRRAATRDWWANERMHFRLFASSFTEAELRRGIYDGQSRAVAACRRVTYLSLTNAVEQCANLYLDERLIPEATSGDATQLAIATIHSVDYLLTWNYAHLANPDVQKRLQQLNDKHGWRTPLLVSPETIPHVRMGKSVRRKRDE